MTNSQFIVDYLQKHDFTQYSDRDITIKLLRLKRFNKYANPLKMDTLRRVVSKLRTAISPRPKKRDIIKDIERLMREYPEATVASLACKLKIKYPQYTLKTLEMRIYHYKLYGQL